jgi:hypothetical protein
VKAQIWVAREGGPFDFALSLEPGGMICQASFSCRLHPEILGAGITCLTFSKFRLASCSRY